MPMRLFSCGDVSLLFIISLVFSVMPLPGFAHLSFGFVTAASALPLDDAGGIDERGFALLYSGFVMLPREYSGAFARAMLIAGTG